MDAATRHAAPRDPDVLVWLIADRYHTGMVFPYDWLLESGFVPPAGFGTPQIRHHELGQPRRLFGGGLRSSVEIVPRPVHPHAAR